MYFETGVFFGDQDLNVSRSKVLWVNLKCAVAH